MRQQLGLFLGPFLALVCWISPLPLETDAHRLAGLMAWVIVWWVCEPIPLAATSILGAALAIVLEIGEMKAVLAPFAHPLIFLFLGGFLLARAMGVHGLDKRFALFMLTRSFIQGKPERSIPALLFVTAFISMWISNTATAAMMLPITLGILAVSFDPKEKSQDTVLIAVAYAASIGGIATPVGSPPNIIAIGYLSPPAIRGSKKNIKPWER